MIKAVVIPAILTGVFCAGFAVVIDQLTNMIERTQVILVSFISGFLGSIFARFVLGKGKLR